MPAKRIVLGVSGGIAAYKACEVLRRLKDDGHDVVVVPTVNALEFVGKATWEALSGHPVLTSVFESVDEVSHVNIGSTADLVVLVPATADLLSRVTIGRADDLLTNVMLVATCPKIVFPAMHTQMWTNPATVENVAKLRSRGIFVFDPASGRLTGKDSGPGRLPEPAEILAVIRSVLVDESIVAKAAAQDLAGLKIALSAGGTHEQLDPVRFIGNASSGRMGVALARAAAMRGAEVIVVKAHVETEMPSSVTVHEVSSTAELGEAMRAIAAEQDVIIMAAAPADFTAMQESATKIKKSGSAGLELSLRQTEDILADLVTNRIDGQILIGFAAETAADETELLSLGTAKLQRKGADLLVLNNVSGGQVFGAEDNSVLIINESGILDRASGDKSVVAHYILDAAKAARIN